MELVEAVTRIDDLDAFVDRLGDIADDHAVTVQAFDARYVVDRSHIERAVVLADRAIARDEAIARDRAVEILLYAAGRRQIDRALAMGISEGECPVVILVDGETRPEGAPRTRTGKARSEQSEDLEGERATPANGVTRERAASREAEGSEASENASGDGGAASREAAAAAAIRDLPAVEPAGTLGEYDLDRVREFFGITDAELGAADGDLAALVGERVALLTVER